MEKKLYELKVDEEFARLIPPLAHDERKMLEESIQKEGCTDPLIVWNGTIIDGHNRYSICKKLNIPFSYEVRDDFSDRDEVKAWIIERQLARRNLTKYQKSQLVVEFEPLLKNRVRNHQTLKKDLNPNDMKNFFKRDNENGTRNKMTNIADVSRDTLAKEKEMKAEDSVKDARYLIRELIKEVRKENINKYYVLGMLTEVSEILEQI